MSIPSTLIAGFIRLSFCGYMGARIVHSLWLIEAAPHRGGSISLMPHARFSMALLCRLCLSSSSTVRSPGAASSPRAGTGRCQTWLRPQGEGTGWLQDAGRIGMACRHRLGQPPIGIVAQEPRLASGAVRWQAQVEERLFHRVVPHAHLHHLARLLRRRHLAPELLAGLHRPLDLPHRLPALLVHVPDVVLVTNTHMPCAAHCRECWEDDEQILHWQSSHCLPSCTR